MTNESFKFIPDMLLRGSLSPQRLVEAAEEAHLQHEDDPELQYEYFNAVLINEVDQEGNSVELGQEFILQPNDHFNDLSVNISLSVVQVPTNMYNKDSAIMNGVYWSEALNKVFVDNFERDPSLIWQYFGSAKGFFRQYPVYSSLLLHISLYLCEQDSVTGKDVTTRKRGSDPEAAS
ncbi:UNVERIFIED_CONTAM: hypothetical protein FKN15_019593 [Acipenser sinensis]